MSNSTNSPASGYQTESLLTYAIKEQTSAYLKKQAVQFASNKTATINDKLGKAGISKGLSSSAINQAVQAAKSASDKLNGVLGGKLSSVLGAGVGGMNLSGAKKQLTNAATGAVSQVTSLVQDKLGSALSGVLGSASGGLLGQALSMVPDSAAKNLTAAKIAPGFLTNGPKDNSLVQDPYGVSDNNILNSVGDKISGFAQDMFGELRSSPSLVSDLTSMLGNGGNFAISKEGLASRVMSALGGQSGMIRNLSDSMKGSLCNGMGLPEGIYDTAISLIGGNATSLNVGNISSAQEIYSLVSSITKSSELGGLFDLGGESSLMSGVMREAIALGMTDAIDVLLDNAKHDDVAYNALYANMQVAVDYSDLDTVNTMVDKIGTNGFLGQCPDAVARLLSNYELPVGTNSANYDNEWNALVAVLDKLQPGWGTVDRNGTLVNDLSFYATVSEDARTLMLRQPTQLVPVLIGSTYAEPRNMIAELKTMYPLVPL